MSKHSKKIDDFYATSPETAEWLFDELRSRYDLKGKTAFEPCVGSFVFPSAGEEMTWKTNDLNQWTDRKPDTQLDFLREDFGEVDFVITNPPFGPGNKLAHMFLEKAARLAPVVAMIVPSSMGKMSTRLHNLMPEDYELVFAERCPCQWFDLPDGTRRPVRTHGIIWERKEGYVRPAPKKPILDTRTDYIIPDDEGKFAIRVYGDGIGDMRPWDETCSGSWVRFNCAKGRQIVALKLLMSFPWRWLTGSAGNDRAPWDDSPGVIPTCSMSTLLHWTNCIAVLEGRQEPIEGVDYSQVLKDLHDRWMVGLQCPEDRLATNKPVNSRRTRPVE